MLHEDELLKRIKEGDNTSLDKLVVRYYPGILRYCLWHTKDRQTAEDATQETFLKTIRHLDGYVHRGKFKAYLYKIAANVCTDFNRKKVTEPLPDDLSEYDSRVEQIEAEMDFTLMLRRLSNEQQEVVLLRFLNELKVREIAEIIGVPMRTVQSRLRSALKRIEKDLLYDKGGKIDEQKTAFKITSCAERPARPANIGGTFDANNASNSHCIPKP